METILVSGGLSLLVGVVLGMLGGGGAILLLPILVYVVGVEPKTAIAMSLLVVGATSLVGGAMHARTGTVRWKAGAIFGAAAMSGAFAGGHLARFVPAPVLLIVFALLMLVSAAAMLRGQATAAPAASRTLAVGRVLALGAAVGVVSGLVGAGGGFLIVPALTLFAGLAMRQAIGTSLFVIALQSFAGFAGHLGHLELDGSLVGVTTAAAVLGTVAGIAFGRRVSQDALRHGFAWLVLAMGIFVVGKQLSLLAAVVAAGGSALALAVLLHKKNRLTTQAQPCTTSPPYPR